MKNLMKSTQQMLRESRERAYLNRCRTPMTVFIGGTVFGLILGLFISAIFISNTLL